MQADETGDRPGGERQQDSRPQLPHDRRPHAHSILLRSLHMAARQGCASDVPRGSGGGRKCSGANSVEGWSAAAPEVGGDVRPFKIRCRPRSASMSDPFSTIARMKVDQQELPFRQWGGARKGAGRKRRSGRPNVPHRPRQGFRKGALHVTLRIRREVEPPHAPLRIGRLDDAVDVARGARLGGLTVRATSTANSGEEDFPGSWAAASASGYRAFVQDGSNDFPSGVSGAAGPSTSSGRDERDVAGLDSIPSRSRTSRSRLVSTSSRRCTRCSTPCTCCSMASSCWWDFWRYSIWSVSSLSLNLKNLTAMTARPGSPTPTATVTMMPSAAITKPISSDGMTAVRSRPGGISPASAERLKKADVMNADRCAPNQA